MAQEIERKFLVKDARYRPLGSYMHIRQGFLSTDKERVVRVRIHGKKAFLTIKGIAIGISRAEYEYKIPMADAKFMLDYLCIQPTIGKYRYNVNIEGFTWEIDEFTGENEGLVIAEIELKSDDQKFPKPEWIGEEVTGDARYYNANLVKNPYKRWKV
jgi:CYTH domain-containing protein